MDLTGYNLSVWGTPKGNKFLQKHLPQIPIVVKDDKIVGENVYDGTGYGLLISWVNPFNPEKVMAVYTGQNPADLVDFNKIMNGSGNYHIFKNSLPSSKAILAETDRSGRPSSTISVYLGSSNSRMPKHFTYRFNRNAIG